MQSNLQGVDERLMWEYGPAVKGPGHRLVITPESNRELRPLVQEIIQRAPRLNGWEFYEYRLPENPEMARMTVKARANFELEGTVFSASLGRDNKINIVYHSTKCVSPEDRDARKAAFVATESLLGEELLERWIGYIDVAPLAKSWGLAKWIGRRKGPRALPLERTFSTVSSLIESVKEQLPNKPLFEFRGFLEDSIDQGGAPEPGRTWTSFGLSPVDKPDYPERRDLFVAISGWKNLWQAMHSNFGFFSTNWSNFGELFCYVKIDGRAGSGEFEDRKGMEDALNAKLVPARAGCVIGGGTGRIYSYIDLALADPTAGIEIVKGILGQGKVNRRSWVLFFDADLADEWVGIFPDSPTPPNRAG